MFFLNFNINNSLKNIIKISKENSHKKKMFYENPSLPLFSTKSFLSLIIILSITLFLNGCNALNPQNGSLEGVVHGKKDNNTTPLSGVLVSISGSANTAYTDKNGHFLLTEAPAGNRTVTIIKEGYATLKLLNVYLEPNIVNKVYFGDPIVLQPKEDTILYDIAIDHLVQKDYQQALDSFVELRDTFPDSPWADDAQYYIGNIYEINGFYIMARDEYSLLLFYYPDSPWADDARMGIGNCYYYTSDYYHAKIQYQTVIDNYQSSDLIPLARYRIAWCNKRLNNNNEAIQDFQQLITLHPQSDYTPPSQYFIGEIYYNLQYYDQAINAFQQTVSNYPSATWPGENRLIVPSAYFYIGYCYEKQGKWAEAIAAYQIIINQYPNSTWDDGKSIAQDAQKRIYEIEKHLSPEEPGQTGDSEDE